MALQIASSRIVRVAELTKLLAVSAQTIYRWQAARTFPPMVRLGPGTVGVDREALDKWFAARIKAAGDQAGTGGAQ